MSLEKGSIEIRPLNGSHDRAAFSCGLQALDDYLKIRANQDRRADVARVFVASGPDPKRVLGYYTLSSFSIILHDLPPDVSKKLPRYPEVPAARIGRLAVDEGAQGQGLGAVLLIDALKRVLGITWELAVTAVVVDAKNESAARFYERHGFLRFPSEPARLFIMTWCIRQLYV